MAENGRNKWIMWLAGILVTLVVMVAMPTMAKSIWDNDIRNTNQHEKIMETMIMRDEKLAESLHKFDVRQEVLIVEVRKLGEKL